MRRVVALLATLTVAAASALPTSGPRAGGETRLDKYQTLLQGKRALVRENALLQMESEIAATKAAYIFFNMKEGKMEFRVRGRGFKSYAFAPITLDERGREPVDPETLWKSLAKPLTVLEVQGAHPELIPPDPNTAKVDGQLYSDPNQLALQTGTGPVHSDAGVLGVDAPTDYYIKLDDGVIFHIRTPKIRTFREKAADRLAEMADSMRATLSSFWGAKEIEIAGKPRLELYMTTDPDTAKNLHFSLLPGEKVFPVPPPPPPIVLVASSRTASASGDTVPAAR